MKYQLVPQLRIKYRSMPAPFTALAESLRAHGLPFAYDRQGAFFSNMTGDKRQTGARQSWDYVLLQVVPSSSSNMLGNVGMETKSPLSAESYSISWLPITGHHGLEQDIWLHFVAWSTGRS
jgi:hypothetical protein